MAYITNDGARLIERARTEGKSIVFGSVRMNTIYKADPTSLVQKSDEWFGENHGSVVGCLSHVSVDDVSQVCDSKLAVQCDDNSESWKSLGIYARLDGEEGEVLFACESIENGEYKDVTLVELPVTLDGVVADFGLSEGGSGGGGGGGEAPANMMTTNTDQTELSGMKTWTWENYYGEGNIETPLNGDRRSRDSISIDFTEGVGNRIPLAIDSIEDRYYSKDGWHTAVRNHRLRITSNEVLLDGESSASWARIINAAGVEQGFDHAPIHVGVDGIVTIGGTKVEPNFDIKIGEYVLLVINNESQIASIRSNSGGVLDISAAVYDSSNMHRVYGIVNNTAGLSFDAPITPAEGQELYIHWTKFPNNI